MAAAALTATAQPAAKPAAATVDSILDDYLKAVGGKSAIEKLTSRHGKGSFEMAAMGMKGSMEIFAKAPNKMLLKMDVPGFGAVQEGYDGAVAWSQNPAQGLREKAGVELAIAKRSAQFHRDARLKELYPKMDLKGEQAVDGRATYLVEATPVEGASERWYFDKETKLLVRMEMEIEGPMGKLPITSDMSDYREINGVKIPWTIKQQAGPMQMAIRVEEMKANTAIDDEMFKKPAAP